MSDWRQRIRDLLKDVKALSFYSADPGGTALLRPIRKEAGDLGIAGAWFADGWARDNADLPDKKPGDSMAEDLRRQPSGHMIAMAQQVDFTLAYKRLQEAVGSGCEVRFFSDHWEDIARLFRPNASEPVVLPHVLFVPDERAKGIQTGGMMKLGLTRKQCDALIVPFMNPAIELSLEQMQRIDSFSAEALKKKYTGGTRKLVTLILDPERKEFSDYTWKNLVMEAFSRISKANDAVFLIKPHPRQDTRVITQHCATVLAQHPGRVLIVDGAVEPYVVASDEIWGMRSVVLELAKRAGKTVRSFPEAVDPAKKPFR